MREKEKEREAERGREVERDTRQTRTAWAVFKYCDQEG